MKYVLLFLMSAVAMASPTGAITISGIVPATTAIVVTPIAGYNALDLSTTAVDLDVATVTEKNNTLLGYKVTLTSLNSGAMKNGVNSIPYTAKYNGASVTLSNVAVQIVTSPPAVVPVNVNKNFEISYTGAAPETRMQGTYADTLTWTITSP